MTNIAIIPARGGSKRIPRKNIKLFCGKPMISYPIQAAKECGLFDRIVVSTDDEEIAEVSRTYGAETPFKRPKNLANDYATTSEVIKHSITELSGGNEEINLVCCLYPTAPLVHPKYLIEGHDKVIASDKIFSFSVTSFSFPIQRAIRVAPNDVVEAIWPENIKARSQDLEPTYHDAGQFYWGRPEGFMDDMPIFSDLAIPIILPRYLVEDIDTPEDWKRVELMYRALEAEKGI